MASGFNFSGAGQGAGFNFNFAKQPPAEQPVEDKPVAIPKPKNPYQGPLAGPDDVEKSRFAILYKSKGLKEATKLRIREQLTGQKERRYDYLTHVRRITECFEEDGEEEEESMREAMEQAEATGNENWVNSLEERKKRRAERKREHWRFRNQLMHSEWLLEKPDDFHTHWVMVPIPQGKRNLVIATGGVTTTYAKNGMMVKQFPSNLPGGGKHKHKWNMEAAIVDCVFNEVTKTYYILDMMYWRQTPMYDTETEFRFYWMHEKFLEVPEVAQIGRHNPFRFEPLPNFLCTEVNIGNVLSCEMSVPLDGILFYHKQTHYTFGFTPLVLWLRPYMIPEALGIMVHQKYIDRAPPDYKGFDKHREQTVKNIAFRDANEKLKKEKSTD